MLLNVQVSFCYGQICIWDIKVIKNSVSKIAAIFRVTKNL